MNCPICSRPMENGYITGHSVLRYLPGEPAAKITRHTVQDMKQLDMNPNSDGWALDVEYTGIAPILRANFCPHCKKVHCLLDVIDVTEEV